MISEVVMPQMGADMQEGTLLRWLKQEGGQVNRGEAIAEIETDKANIEIEAFGSGVMRKLLAKEGETVPVGHLIALIAAPEDDISKYDAGAEPSAATASVPAPATSRTPAAVEIAHQAATESTKGDDAIEYATGAAPTPAAAAPPAETAATPVTQGASPPHPNPLPQGEWIGGQPDGRLRASPVARRLAEEGGIDLLKVQGTGPDGRIVRRDVEEAAAALAAAAAQATSASYAAAPHGEDQVTDVPLSRMRQTIARRMQESKQTVPHYYLGAEIDMTEALRMQSSVNQRLGERGRITVNDVIVLAVSRTLVQHPKFNAHWVDGHVQHHSQVNVSIAVALTDGLVAPALLDCANKGLLQISEEARDLAGRARGGVLKPEEYTAGTFSISNVGPFGIEQLIAIVTPPQVGVLGVGASKPRPVVRDGETVVRDVMQVYLSADHRATDGADGARFLQTLRQLLETPAMMLV